MAKRKRELKQDENFYFTTYAFFLGGGALSVADRSIKLSGKFIGDPLNG